jgi:hypothetical protein
VGHKSRAARGKQRRGGAGTALAATDSDVAQLRRELAEAREQLAALMREGVDPYTKRRLAELEDARQVARGQALEAAAARSRAEAELTALRAMIERPPGLRGRLPQWLARILGKVSDVAAR